MEIEIKEIIEDLTGHDSHIATLEISLGDVSCSFDIFLLPEDIERIKLAKDKLLDFKQYSAQHLANTFRGAIGSGEITFFSHTTKETGL